MTAPWDETKLDELAARMNLVLAAGRAAGIQPTSEGTMGMYMLGVQMMVEFSATPLNEEIMRFLLEGAYDIVTDELRPEGEADHEAPHA